MSKVEIILWVTALVALGSAMESYRQYKRLEKLSKAKVHRCMYNDNPKCYERPCGYCIVKGECNICCGGNCNKCIGHKVEFIDKKESE